MTPNHNFSVLAAFVLLLLPSLAQAFIQPSSQLLQQRNTNTNTNASSSLSVAPEYMDSSNNANLLDSTTLFLSAFLSKKSIDPETARGEFYFFFFAGSGAGGIGLAQLPRIYGELKGIRNLGDLGPSEGGDAASLGLSSLIYPTIYVKDALKAIRVVPTCDQIRKQGTSESYLVSKGYIDRDDFVRSCKNCNPLTAYALFEALSGGSGGVVSPDKLEASLERYRSSADPAVAFLADLQAATTTKIAAYGGLLFLLFIVFGLIFETGSQAFF